MMHSIRTLVQRLTSLRTHLLRPRRTWALALGLMLAMGSTAQAQVSGISYSFSPILGRMTFSDDAKLSNGYLYGGELGLRFGKFLELGGEYLLSSTIETEPSQSWDDFIVYDYSSGREVLGSFDGLGDRRVSLRRYGGKLRLNAGSRRFVPSVSVGTGVLNFDPEGVDESQYLYVNAGIGITFSVVDRFIVSLAAETLAYEYNPVETFLSNRDLEATDVTHRYVSPKLAFMRTLSASLKLFVGGHTDYGQSKYAQERYSRFRGSTVRLAVEPFYGQINFNDKLGLSSSSAVAGIAAGFDLGSYVGLRAFYWRNTDQEVMFGNSTHGGTSGVSYYGGELDLRLNSQYRHHTIAPYLIFGIGYMNMEDDVRFSDLPVGSLASRYFAMAGGGLEFSVGSMIKLQGSLRNVMMSCMPIEFVNQPRDISSSLMYTLGLKVNIGGSGRSRRTRMMDQMETERAAAEAYAEAMSMELARIQAQLDSLEANRSSLPDSLTAADSLALDSLYTGARRMSNLSGQTLTIPVPEEGEIYIRFGNAPHAVPIETTQMPPIVVTIPDGDTLAHLVSPAPQVLEWAARDTVDLPVGMTEEQIREIVRQAVSDELDRERPSEVQVDESLRRMEERIERQVAREIDRLREEQRMAQEAEVVQDPTDTTEDRHWLRSIGPPQLVALLPSLGLRFDDVGPQLLLGFRGDYRFEEQSFRVMPEVGLGIGSQVSISAMGNIAWDLREFGPVNSYAGAGLGLIADDGLSHLEFALNLLVGAEYSIWGRARLFTEYSTQDFFDVSRLIVGYRLRY